ncbi:unnamed protein product [Miscanthus lutarioriparius]|uniref:Fucosyltransferase n=1 Tax=Miscanthus lutarioriparius TaxID=422564 RepID=A0A811NCR9_9POAL|nr:unnamed protein product [Miscanthus lutarioriparius]
MEQQGLRRTLLMVVTTSSAGFCRRAWTGGRRSRYESWLYYKYFPHAASPYLQRKLRAYEARHRRCAPGTPLYAKSLEQLRSGRSADGMECTYVVWLPFDGLGNRMLSMHIEKSYTRLLYAKVVGPDANATAGVPAYVYLSMGWQLKDPLFFCGEHQLVLAKVNWLLLYSDLYFAQSPYAVAEFQDELRRLFPAKESVSHLLSRYLFHPTNPVWSLTTRYYRSYLASVKRRIGVQIRMFSYGSIPADDMYAQILACSRQAHILPDTGGGGGASDNGVLATRSDDNGDGSNSTAILVASLYADYYERLRSRYYEHAAKGGETVAVFQPSHEERQATDNLAHNQTAYGHKVPEPPCRRAVSMEPCNLTPPWVWSAGASP